jgi:IS5 family transposase
LRARHRSARNDEAARQPIEGIFGRGKRRWSLARIMAKLANTSATVIALVFLVMNLEAIMLSSCLLVLAVALVLLDRQPLEPVFAGFATR